MSQAVWHHQAWHPRLRPHLPALQLQRRQPRSRTLVLQMMDRLWLTKPETVMCWAVDETRTTDPTVSGQPLHSTIAFRCVTTRRDKSLEARPVPGLSSSAAQTVSVEAFASSEKRTITISAERDMTQVSWQQSGWKPMLAMLPRHHLPQWPGPRLRHYL